MNERTIPASDRQVEATDNEIISTELLAINNSGLDLDLKQLEAKAAGVPARIDDDITSGTWQDVIKELDGIAKHAKAIREETKAPYLRAAKIVDGFFFALSSETASQTPGRVQRARYAIAQVVSDYLTRKELAERKRREAAEAAAREAARVAEEARRKAELARIQSEQDMETQRRQASAAERERKAQAEAAVAEARAFEAQQQAAAKPHELARVRSEAGSLATPKVTWEFEIIDLDDIPGKDLWRHVPRSGKEAAIRAYIKASAPDTLADDANWQPIRGVKMIRKRGLSVR